MGVADKLKLGPIKTQNGNAYFRSSDVHSTTFSTGCFSWPREGAALWLPPELAVY